jgi:hypothetical protein
LRAVNDDTPIPHPTIIAAFAANTALVGKTIRCTWCYAEGQLAGVKVTWDGRVLGYGDGKTQVFYWRGQPHFPDLAVGIPGVIVLLPREGVQYWRIEVTEAAAAGDVELQQAMEKEAAAILPPPTPIQLLDVSTWQELVSQRMGHEILKNKISQYASVSAQSSAKRSGAFASVSLWLDTARDLDSWQDVPSFVALGNGLMVALRLVVAEETLHLSQEEVQRQLRAADDANPLEQAIAKAQAASSSAKKKPGFRKCNTCGKVGHTAAYCYSGEGKEVRKNGAGSVKKDK